MTDPHQERTLTVLLENMRRRGSDLPDTFTYDKRLFHEAANVIEALRARLRALEEENQQKFTREDILAALTDDAMEGFLRDILIASSFDTMRDIVMRTLPDKSDAR